MGRTRAVAEWNEEDGGFVVDLDATELIAALHEEDIADDTAHEVVVTVSPAPALLLQRAI